MGDTWSDLTDTDTAEDRALSIEVRGKKLPWLIDGKAIRVMKTRHGTDLKDILSAAYDLALQGAAVQGSELSEEELEGLSEKQVEALAAEADGADVMELTDMYEAVGRLLWAGAVRFEPELGEEEVCGLVGPDNIRGLPLGPMIARAFPDEGNPDEEDDTAGKASPKKETS
ncbi:hypothetical protein [Salinibacter altiplanensis]|uniref:hypothetical protein n=1 Tax=Salinibacter altiplanensis TaxID=1803181 RepID=UPI000C9FE676|nr:hypothetical protein [Salinibacter altiplanensis]